MGGVRRPGACDETGFTLIELLVAISIFAVVLVAVFALLDFATRSASSEIERDASIAEVGGGLSRMVTEIRDAYQINGPTGTETSDWIDFLIRPGASSDYRVIYNCNKPDPRNSALNACIRYQVAYAPSVGLTSAAGTVPSGATSLAVVPRVINRTSSDASDYVFTHLTEVQKNGHGDTYGNVTVHTPGRGEGSSSTIGIYKYALTLTDSFYLRQLDFGR